MTVVNIALPSAQADLGFDDDARQWVITAYALAFGLLLLLGGRISDLIGRVLLATSGLSALVYGFASAEMHGWAAPLTVVLLAYGVVSLAAFVALERRVAHPLLPLAVVRDRNRGAAFLAIGITGLATFAAFLFLTYYL